LGWSLWAYEAVIEVTPQANPAELLTLEFSNRRDHEQARNLCRVLAAAPAEPLLVWTGGGHASKQATHGWVTLGGTAGILRDQAPPPLNSWPGVDAVIISTENTLT
jgi:hypothetical protein